MRGILTDIHRRPDQFLEAESRVLEMEFEFALYYARVPGLTAAFIPLHRGSDGSCRFRSSRSSTGPSSRN